MDPWIRIHTKISWISNTVQNRTLPPPPRHLLPPPQRRTNQAKNGAQVPAQREEDQNPRRRREAAGRPAGTASRPAGACDRRPDGPAVGSGGRGRTGPGPSRRMSLPWSDGTRWVGGIRDLSQIVLFISGYLKVPYCPARCIGIKVASFDRSS